MAVAARAAQRRHARRSRDAGTRGGEAANARGARWRAAARRAEWHMWVRSVVEVEDASSPSASIAEDGRVRLPEHGCSTWMFGVGYGLGWRVLFGGMTHPMVMMRGGMRDPNAKRPPLRERLVALRVVPRLIRLVWETKPSYAAAMIVLRFVAIRRARGESLDRQAHHRRDPASRARRRVVAPPLAARRARDGNGRRRRTARARVGARRGSARRPVHESDQHPHHGARGDARSAPVRGSRSSTITSSARGRGRAGASRCSRSSSAWGRAC